jgi:hypothetical protein
MSWSANISITGGKRMDLQKMRLEALTEVHLEAHEVIESQEVPGEKQLSTSGFLKVCFLLPNFKYSKQLFECLIMEALPGVAAKEQKPVQDIQLEYLQVAKEILLKLPVSAEHGGRWQQLIADMQRRIEAAPDKSVPCPPVDNTDDTWLF